MVGSREASCDNKASALNMKNDQKKIEENRGEVTFVTQRITWLKNAPCTRSKPTAELPTLNLSPRKKTQLPKLSSLTPQTSCAPH